MTPLDSALWGAHDEPYRPDGHYVTREGEIIEVEHKTSESVPLDVARHQADTYLAILGLDREIAEDQEDRSILFGGVPLTRDVEPGAETTHEQESVLDTLCEEHGSLGIYRLGSFGSIRIEAEDGTRYFVSAYGTVHRVR